MSYEFDKVILPRIISSKPEEPIMSSTTLQNYLTHMITRQEHSAEMPKKIDLGELDHMVNTIMYLTKAHPAHPEHGTCLLYDRQTKQFSFTDIVQGDKDSAVLFFPEDRTLACIIHSHPDDTPFSSTDIELLFPNRELHFPPSAAIIVTPTRKTLLAKTQYNASLQEELYPYFVEVDNKPKLRHEAMFSITRIAQNYGLKIYSAPHDQRVLSLAS